MDKKFNDELDTKIQNNIDSFKKIISNHIKKLESIKALIPSNEIKSQLSTVIDDLKNASEIQLSDLRIKKNEDIKDYKQYEYNEKQFNLINKDINKTKANKNKYNSNKYQSKLISLNQKKGKIYMNQLKVADKIVVEKLEKYKRENNIDYNKLYKIEEKFNKNLLKFGEEAKLLSNKEKLEDSLLDIDYTDKQSIENFKANKKELKSINKRINKLSKKTGIGKNALSNTIAHDIKPNIITKMKQKAQLIKRNISDNYYIKKIAELEAKSGSR